MHRLINYVVVFFFYFLLVFLMSIGIFRCGTLCIAPVDHRQTSAVGNLFSPRSKVILSQTCILYYNF